ncbi:MAG: TetR family transcriptional regulator [Proteobacteria bacterium]|nr:MAG: TetR family transcriptional regulator [Pseudomonadota bacterium]
MARRPARESVTKPIDPSLPDREKIIAAFMALLAERPFEEIGLNDIAGRAGTSLVAIRTEFGSKIAILAAHAKELDRKVLSGQAPDMADEEPRERLFDVLMRRLEAMASERAAIRSLLRSAMFDPPLALALNSIGVRSQQWMLAAAGIDTAGPGGMLRAQGLAILFARVLRTFVDDDEDNARTMAALDRELDRGGRMLRMYEGLCRLTPFGRPRRRRREDDGDEMAAA